LALTAHVTSSVGWLGASVLAGLVALLIALGYLGAGEWGRGSATSSSLVVPALSSEARAGREAFNRLCSTCHGASASGSATGPPLVHRIYGPGHHADAAFTLAAQRGVRAHHWRFGDMPPVPSARLEEIGLIVRYVRELQRANGIE
jgi:mono/diheme cytochrome c family protein